MEARICDRCGAIWKDAKEEAECGVFVEKVGISFRNNRTEHMHLCKTCIGGLYRYLNNEKDGK